MTNPSAKSSLNFSVIIPTLNEERWLPKLLKDLKDQTLQNFEVIVVDGNSDDNTVKKAKQFSSFFSLKVIDADKRNVSYQRNLGVNQAKYNWLIFMDADNRLPNDFFEELNGELEKNSEIDAFTCWLKVDAYPAIYKPFARFLNFGFSLIGSEAMGALIGIKNELFKQFKFDENQQFAEDTDLIKRITEARHSFKIFHNPRYVYSPRRADTEGIFKLASASIEGRIKMLLNQPLEKFEKYPMLGGGYYCNKQGSRFVALMKEIDQQLSKASAKQLNKAKRIWQAVIDEIVEE